MFQTLLQVAAVPSPTTGSGLNDFSAGQFAQGELVQIEAGILVLMLLTLASPLLLAWRIRGFFQIPFITWYLLHAMVASLAILAVVGLAFAGSLSAPLIAIFSTLFGVIFGSAANRPTASTSKVPLTATRVDPAVGSAGHLVRILGQGFEPHTTARVGAAPLQKIVVSPDGTVLTGILGDGGPGMLDVVVENADQSRTLQKAFTYEPRAEPGTATAT